MTYHMQPIRSFEEAERYFNAKAPFSDSFARVPLAGHDKPHLALFRSEAGGSISYELLLHDTPLIAYDETRFYVHSRPAQGSHGFIAYHLPQTMRLVSMNGHKFIHTQGAYYQLSVTGMFFDRFTLQPLAGEVIGRQRPMRNCHYPDTLKRLREYRAWHTVMRRLHARRDMVRWLAQEQLAAIEKGDLHDLSLILVETDVLIAYLMHRGPRPGYTLERIDHSLPLRHFPPEVRHAYREVTLS